MSNEELVKRLRKRQEFESIDGYKRIEWKDEDALEAADRIEELEDKLVKTVRGLNAISVWGEDTYARDMARTTLAEIEGEKPW
jgi:hypothetical protein